MASAEDIQQGDPLGRLLFCAALSSILAMPCCDFVGGYLDDVTLGGPIDDLAGEVILYQTEAAKIGLELNIAKCEIIGIQYISRSAWSNSILQFLEPSHADAQLLGSTIYNPGIDKSVLNHANSFEWMCARLQLLTSHEALFILKSSLTMPKWLYMLLTSPCFLSEYLITMDLQQREGLSRLLNIFLIN